MKQSVSAPLVRVSKWPGQMTDESWEGRVRINARRVRDGYAEFLSEFPWETFVTFTFDPRRAPNVSERSVSREVFRWCGDVSRWSRRPVRWAYAVEGGGGGSLHAHALIIDARDAALEAGRTAWEARSGSIRTRAVDDIGWAARYLCKQIGPNGEVVLSDTLRRNHRAAQTTEPN